MIITSDKNLRVNYMNHKEYCLYPISGLSYNLEAGQKIYCLDMTGPKGNQFITYDCIIQEVTEQGVKFISGCKNMLYDWERDGEHLIIKPIPPLTKNPDDFYKAIKDHPAFWNGAFEYELNFKNFVKLGQMSLV